MSFYIADASGHLEDLGGVTLLRQWARTQEPVIRQFFAQGVSDRPQELATALRNATVSYELKPRVTALADIVDRAEELVILSHGT